MGLLTPIGINGEKNKYGIRRIAPNLSLPFNECVTWRKSPPVSQSKFIDPTI